MSQENVGRCPAAPAKDSRHFLAYRRGAMSGWARPTVFRSGSVLVVCVAAVLSAAPAMARQPAPPNDDFKDAIAIRLGQTVKGTITGATAEALHDESEHSVWYRFRAKRGGMVNVGLCGARFYSAIVVYVGRSLRSLRRIRYSEDACRAGGFGVAFRARRGRSYAIAVLGESAPRVPRGSFRLKVGSVPTPPNDDFVDALPLQLGARLSGTTAGGTGERGEPRRCCGFAHTVWYRLRVGRPSQVLLHSCNRSHPLIAVYTGDRVNGLTKVRQFGVNCFVQFAAHPGVSYSVVVDDKGGWGTFRLSALAVTPPPNDDFADATAITLGNTASATTLYATREPGEPVDPEYAAASFTVWFRLPVVSTTVVELDWSGSGYCGRGVDAVNVYTGHQLSQLQEVSQEDVPTRGCASRFDAPPGVYSLRGAAGPLAQGNFQLTARAVQAPP